MTPLDVFLLAGGRSSRMGRDKALLDAAGATFLERIAAAARPLARSIAVVGREAAPEPFVAVPDLRPGLGPLAGIESALAAARTPAALVVACDLPMVTTAFFERLVARASEAPDRILVVEDADGRVTPLCGVYPATAREVAARLLDEGERRPRMLLDAVGSRALAFAEYRDLPGASRLLENVNTPDEYRRLLDALTES